MRFVILLATALFALPAVAAEPDTVRPELGKPLQAAQELIQAHKYHDALSKVRDADAIGAKTATETGVVEQLRLIAATGAGEPAIGAKAFEALAGAGRVPQPQLARYAQAIGNSYYQVKEYAQAAAWGNRYYAEGGTDPQVRILVAQSLYLGGDYAGVVRAIAADQTRAGEGQLQLLAAAYEKLGDGANAITTLEYLVAVAPKPEYWADLIHRVSTRPGFASRLELDVGRLRLALGGLSSAEQYVEQAELTLQAGLPGEAVAVIEKGFAAGLLGGGADADRHRRLRDLAAKSATGDRAGLAKAEQEAAAAKDGNALVATGLDYLGYGQPDKAAALISQGIAKGGLKHSEDATLHLGIALSQAGDKAKAADALRAVQGGDGTADLARLWLARAGRAQVSAAAP